MCYLHHNLRATNQEFAFLAITHINPSLWIHESHLPGCGLARQVYGTTASLNELTHVAESGNPIVPEAGTFAVAEIITPDEHSDNPYAL